MFKRIAIGLLVGVVIFGAVAVCYAQEPKPSEKNDHIASTVDAGVSDMPTEAAAVAGGTDVGVVRDHNEDSYGIFREEGVYLVADGMGGHAAGEVASALAVERIGSYVHSPFHQIFRKAWPEMAILWLEEAYRDAHRTIFRQSMREPSQRGMGTTAVSILTTPKGVWIVNLGDSRAYRIRGNVIEQLSHDHSLVQELIDAGELKTPEEIARFPYKNIITRVMGTESNSMSDTFYDRPQSGDIYVLCSDGLTNEVSEERMVSIIRKNGDNLEASVAELIEQARQHGGRDNITVILVRM